MSFEGALRLEIAGSPLYLLREKAIFLAESKVLVVADTHLGKDFHFTRHGLPVDGPTRETIENLQHLIDLTRPARIVFAGDLFHSSLNESWPAFAEFARSIGLPVSLARGNHDIIPTRRYDELGIESADLELFQPAFDKSQPAIIAVQE